MGSYFTLNWTDYKIKKVEYLILAYSYPGAMYVILMPNYEEKLLHFGTIR